MTAKLRYAVFGKPIAHSLSPRIHAMFAAQFGIEFDYRAIEAGRDDFAQALDAFTRDGGVGANVTLPLKQVALSLCGSLNGRAQRSGSVNTLIRVDGHWRGDNTDGYGFLHDLYERHAFGTGRRCLLLGAGGAARAVAFTLIGARPGALVIANRTQERAQELATAIGAANVEAVSWDALGSLGTFDLVVHATAAGHGGAPLELPASIGENALCYDLSYGEAAGPFLRWAKSAGASRIDDGLGMLVEQAARSFFEWRDYSPDTPPVFDALRREYPLVITGA